MDTSSGQPFLDALKGRPVRPLPLWLMRQAGRYLPEYRATRSQAGDFLTLCYTPKLAAEVTLQPIRRFAFDAAIIFSDILLVPQALGLGLKFVENEGPHVEAVEAAGGLARLSLAGMETRLEPVYAAIAAVKAALPRGVSLIGFAGAPWTIATYMVGARGGADIKAAKLWTYQDPTTFARLMDLVVEATALHLVNQARAGADALQLFDTWAGELSDDGFTRWSLEPTRAIVERVRKAFPTIPIIGFPRGAGARLADYAQYTGVDAVSLDSTVSLDWARQAVPSRLALQGNLDPLLLVAGGDAMRRSAEQICAGFADRHAVFNLGHGILPETPIPHVEDLVAAVRGARP